ncbi:hypothetical protein [Nonomuraea angiospora]|uniref:hypothetical protein n=1 Tax=Nonomuraea angiospora TaxID=46172 RepID=UPI0029AF7B81|nr:hypothetical protein [Nonomuraea angiospora]MDX3101684.1 hypothetical protein [Nonomuraea angiospora]
MPPFPIEPVQVDVGYPVLAGVLAGLDGERGGDVGDGDALVGGQASTLAWFQNSLTELVRQQFQVRGEAPAGIRGNVGRGAGRQSWEAKVTTVTVCGDPGLAPSISAKVHGQPGCRFPISGAATQRWSSIAGRRWVGQASARSISRR